MFVSILFEFFSFFCFSKGDYPLKSVEVMRRIARNAEKNTNYLDYQARLMRSIPKPLGISESIASSAVICARQVNAALILCLTEVGGTARLVAKYRPQIPVVGATLIDQTARQLSMSFGLVPYYHNGSAVSFFFSFFFSFCLSIFVRSRAIEQFIRKMNF